MTVTNLSNLKSINFESSGPSHYSIVDNTLIGTGPLVLFLDPTELPPGLSTVAYTIGRIVVQLDDLGNTASISFSGRAQNVCELLQ